MAHEIAHNVLSHVQNEKLQAVLGSFLEVMETVSGAQAASTRGDVSKRKRIMWEPFSRSERAMMYWRLGKCGIDWEGSSLNRWRLGGKTHPSTAERLANHS